MSRIVLVGLGHAHLHVVEHAARLREAGAQVALVDDGRFWYSSIASGLLAGQYEPADDVIEAAPFARGCGVDYVEGRAASLDREARQLVLESGRRVEYDVVSFNVGSGVTPPFPVAGGVTVHGAKPIEGLLDLRESLRADMRAGRTPRVVTVGGNHSGCELTCNLAALARAEGGSLDLLLLHGGTELVANEPPGARRKMRAVLAGYGVDVRDGVDIERVEEGRLVLASGGRVAFDHLLLATGLSAAPVMRRLGLDHSARGLRVTPALHAPDDDRVFAIGDCADIRGPGVPDGGLPKVGVFGVRAAPVLLDNLVARATGEPLRSYKPQRVWFASQNLGDGTGLASYGHLWWRGRSALAIKRTIDRRFMARYRALYAD